MNVTVNGTLPVIGDAEKLATGGTGRSKTVTIAVFKSVPFELLTVRETVSFSDEE
jgi:hypothetical protein